MFGQYVAHGWVLAPIRPGTKGPRTKGWNERARCIDDVARADRLEGAGLCHAYSGTCAIDVDDFDGAQEFFLKRGIDLLALFADRDSVQITSGTANRGKLLYKLTDPLPTKMMADGAFELRCGTAKGTTVQDVLPPSVHPNGNRYEWIGDYHYLPELPPALKQLWLDVTRVAEPSQPAPAPVAEASEIEKFLESQDPDCEYHEWIKIGMAVHHELGVGGFAFWDAWSSTGSKYPGTDTLIQHWQSFGESPTPVTIGSLRKMSIATPDEFEVITDEDIPADNPWDLQAKADAMAFEFVPLRTLAAGAPPKYVVDAVLPRAELATVYGESGSGKSFLVLDIAFAVAAGTEWNGHAVERGNVAWIAAEAAGSMRNRAKAFAQAGACDIPEGLDVCGETPDLANTTHIKALIAATVRVAPTLVVVDTLAAAAGGANENSGEDMGKVLAGCRAIHNATGALVLLIHHSGKDRSRGARGWSGLRAAVHAELEVTTMGDVRNLRVSKMRDGEEGTESHFKLEPVPLDMDGNTSCVVRHLGKEAGLANIPAEKPRGAPQTRVMEFVGQVASLLGGVPVTAVVDDVVDGLPERHGANGRDRRKRKVTEAIKTLIEKNLLRQLGDEIFLEEAN